MSASSTDDHPVNAVVTLIENSDASVWSDSKPTARHYYDDPQGDRGPAAGQPPIIYAWSPTDGDIQQFSADNARQLEYVNVELLIYSYDPQRTAVYQRDLIQFLSEYADDNESLTEFHYIQAVTRSDYRSETPARSSDHYVMGLEVEVEDLRRQGVQ